MTAGGRTAIGRTAPWFWRSLPLNQQTGSEVFSKLFASESIATLLESPFPPSPDYPYLGRFSICAGGPRRLGDGSLAMWTPESGEVLSFLRSLTASDSPDVSNAPKDLPFVGGWLGWLGYDLAWEIESLPVMHLVSNVRGKLRSQFDGIDLIRATFPGGTITGCPKVRCMEIIEELEPVRRSLFYGSCGYLDLRGRLDLNILIRTLLYAPNQSSSAQVWGQVGAGIVTDSMPSGEWYESLQKATAQLKALGEDIR